MELRIHGQPIRIEGVFELEAVGSDWDGTYKPFASLQYKVQGWLDDNDQPIIIDRSKE
jgi:hypothetical protein